MLPGRMNPLDYHFPFDFDGLDTVEEREAATGVSWRPEEIARQFVSAEEAQRAQVSRGFCLFGSHAAALCTSLVIGAVCVCVWLAGCE